MVYRVGSCQCKRNTLSDLSFRVDHLKVSELLQQRGKLGIKPFYILCVEVSCSVCGFNLKALKEGLLTPLNQEQNSEFQNKISSLFCSSVSELRRI